MRILERHCPFVVATDATLRFMTEPESMVGRIASRGKLHLHREFHRATTRDCPDYRGHQVGWQHFPRRCRVQAQRLIDENETERAKFASGELKKLEGLVCFPDMPAVERLVHMLERDSYATAEDLEPFLDGIGEKNYDSEGLINAALSWITAQDGDPDKLFEQWRVGELAY